MELFCHWLVFAPICPPVGLQVALQLLCYYSGTAEVDRAKLRAGELNRPILTSCITVDGNGIHYTLTETAIIVIFMSAQSVLEKGSFLSEHFYRKQK